MAQWPVRTFKICANYGDYTKLSLRKSHGCRCVVWGASSDGAESGPTYNELAEQTDHGHRDATGARPQPAGVPQPRDDPADVVAHVAALTLPHTTRTLHTALSTTITSSFEWSMNREIRFTSAHRPISCNLGRRMTFVALWHLTIVSNLTFNCKWQQLTNMTCWGCVLDREKKSADRMIACF